MKKIYSMLLIAALSLTGLKANAADWKAGDQFFWSEYLLFLEVDSIKTVGSFENIYVKIIAPTSVTPGFFVGDQPTTEEMNAYTHRNKLDIPVGYQEVDIKSKRIAIQGIGQGAFLDNTHLRTVTVATNYNYSFTFGNHCFSGCTKLDSLTLGDRSSYTFEIGAFQGCSALDFTEIDLKRTTYIGANAFENTNTGASGDALSIPETVTFMGNGICSGTPLTDLDLNCNIDMDYASAFEAPFYSIRGQLQMIEASGWSSEHLPAYMFYDMPNATISLPSFTSYGAYSLYNCRGAFRYTLDVSDATAFGDSVFVGINCGTVLLPYNAILPAKMGKGVFGQMETNGTTLFVLDQPCDEELLELTRMENDYFDDIDADGRLVQRGTKATPERELVARNEYPKGITYGGGVLGSIVREPSCSMNSFVLSMPDNSRMLSWTADGDTVRNYRFYGFDYGNTLYQSMDEIPLSSSTTQKVYVVYAPEFIMQIDCNVALPQAGHSVLMNDVEVTVPDGAAYKWVNKKIYNAAGNTPTESELLPNTEYVFRATFRPVNEATHEFPLITASGTTKPLVELLTCTINGQTPEEVLSFSDGGVALHIRFTTNAEGLESVANDAQEKSVKMLHDGQLLIIRNGHTYNAQGAVVK